MRRHIYVHRNTPVTTKDASPKYRVGSRVENTVTAHPGPRAGAVIAVNESSGFGGKGWLYNIKHDDGREEWNVPEAWLKPEGSPGRFQRNLKDAESLKYKGYFIAKSGTGYYVKRDLDDIRLVLPTSFSTVEAAKKAIDEYGARLGTDARNHLGEREYQTYAGWRAAARAAGATRYDGNADIATAFNAEGKAVGEWGGDVGSIYTTDRAHIARLAADAGKLSKEEIAEIKTEKRRKGWPESEIADYIKDLQEGRPTKDGYIDVADFGDWKTEVKARWPGARISYSQRYARAWVQENGREVAAGEWDGKTGWIKTG